MKPPHSSFIALVCILALQASVQGQVRIGPELSLSPRDVDESESPSVAIIDEDSYVVAWEDDVQVRARVVNLDGQMMPLIDVSNVTKGPGDHDSPSVAYMGSEQFVVAWNADGESGDGDGDGVFARIFSISGEGEPEFRVSSTAASDQSQIEVVVLGSMLVFAWENETDAGSNVALAAFTSSGTPVVPERIVGEGGSHPVLAALGGSKVVIAWEGGDGDGSGVRAKVLDLVTGAELPEFCVNEHTAGDQDDADIAAIGDDHFVIVWEDESENDGSDNGVFASTFRLFDDGTVERTLSEFQVNTQTFDDQDNPAVAAVGNHSFVVSWESWAQDGDSEGIFAAVFGLDGVQLIREFQVNSFFENEQDDVDVVAVGSKLIFTYESDTETINASWPYLSEIMVQVFEIDLAPSCSDGIQNQGEAGVDCGGPCLDAPMCPTCSDGVQNGDEQGIDCGGPCQPCACSCDWIPNNHNTDGEVFVGYVSSASACIAKVREVCPWANIANYDDEGEDCWCQLGDDRRTQVSSDWDSCWLSDATCQAPASQCPPGEWWHTRQRRCKDCYKPANARWTVPDSTPYRPWTCPWECEAGRQRYGNKCLGCTTGKWWNASHRRCSRCRGLPDHAHWVAPSETVLSAWECSWECDHGFIRALGACEPAP